MFALSIHLKCAALIVLASGVVSALPSGCEPSLEIQRELERAASSPLPEGASFDQKVEPFRSLRDRFPDDLFVHARYQDAVTANGIEGHLRRLQNDYSALRRKHLDDVMYLYLYGRSLEGRATKQAISTMEEVLRADASFAPAHQTLVEIYSRLRFRDRVKEKSARKKFAALCPNAVLSTRPLPVSPKSNFASRMVEISKEVKDPDRVPELVYRAVQDEEWRLQRIRAFDWYDVHTKRQVAVDAQSAHWKGLEFLVRHYWKNQRSADASKLLVDMRERVEKLERPEFSAVYWSSALSLLDLYALTKEVEKARELLAQMERSSAVKGNAKRAAQLAEQKRRFRALSVRGPA